MAATKEDIRGWFHMAKQGGYSHMLVVCDRFDYSDYPVFAMTPEEAAGRYDAPGEMQRVMEVYDLTLGLEDQLAEQRALHLPPRR